MGRLLIVDGSNLLFQMFFGMPARITGKDGKAIQGTLGFLGALFKIYKKVAPTHLIVLFDGPHHNPRCDIDCAYKANRPDWETVAEEENPFTQLPDIKRALAHLGIPHFETVECESDDLVASYVKARGDMEIVVSSYDSDFFQLIDEDVTIFRYRGDASYFCDEAYLWEKLHIHPSQYRDYKCLLGDTADNIRGIDGIGPKRASELLATYGSLDGIMEHLEKISQKRIAQNLEEGFARLALNKALITLDGTAPIPFPIAELAYILPNTSTREVLTAIGVM